MATQSTTLEILLSIKNQTGEVLKRVSADVQGLKASLSGLNTTAKQAGSGTQDLVANLTKGKSEIAGLVSGVQGLMASLGGLVLLDKLKGLADVAARSQVLKTVLIEIGRASGYSAEEITKYDQAVQKMGITAAASRQTLTQMLQAGLDVSKAAELARASQNFAVVAGQNSSETLRRIILNIQQTDVVGLRFIGVNVDMTEATEKFARSLGKTGGELSKAERQTALLNAVLEKGRESGNLYVAAMGDVGKAVQSLARLEENLSETLGEVLLPAYKALVDEYTTFLRQAILLASAQNQNSTAAEQLAETVRGVASAVRQFTIFLLENKEVLTAVLQILLSFAAARAAMLIFAFGSAQVAIFTGWITTLTAALKTYELAVIGAGTATAKGMAIASAGFALALTGAFLVGQAIGEWALQFRVFQRTGELVFGVVLLLFRALTLDIKGIAEAWQYLVDAWNDNLGPKGAKKTTQELNALLDEQLKLQETLIELENKLVEANKSGSKEQQAEAQKAFDLAKKRNAEIEESRKKLLASGTLNNAEVEARKAADAAAAAVKKVEITYRKLYEEVAKAKETLKIPADLGSTFRSSVLSTEFSKVSTAFKQLVEGFKQGGDFLAFETKRITAELVAKGVAPVQAAAQAAKEASQRAVPSINDLRVGIASLSDAAKGPDEIAVALELVETAGDLAKDKMFELQQTLNFNLAKAAIKQVEDQLVGYSASTTKARDALSLLRSVQDTTSQSTRTFAETLTSLGFSSSAAFDVLGRGAKLTLDSLASGYTRFKSTITETSQQFKAGLEQQTQSLREQYEQSIRLLEAATQKKLDVESRTVSGVQTSRAAIRAIEEQSTAERVKLVKDYFDKLVQFRDQALGKFKEFAQQVKSLDEEIFQNGQNKAKALRDIKRQGLTEEQQFADRLLEIQELKAREQEAVARRQFDLAKDLNSQRITLAQSLSSASGVDKEAALKQAAIATNDVYEDRDSLLKKTQVEAKKAADEQLATYQALSAEIGVLTGQLQSLASDQVSKVKLELEPGTTRRLLDELQSALDSRALTVTVNAQLGGTTSRRFASGGGVQGSGHDTSDNIPAWLSPGEWVTRARAVRHYGADLFRRLNDMTLPRTALRFAAGGLVPSSFGQSYAGLRTADGTGLETAVKRDIVDVNLNFNGKRTTLMGERDQVRGLVSALRTLEGSK